jgi:hypothetical protein
MPQAKGALLVTAHDMCSPDTSSMHHNPFWGRTMYSKEQLRVAHFQSATFELPCVPFASVAERIVAMFVFNSYSFIAAVAS